MVVGKFGKHLLYCYSRIFWMYWCEADIIFCPSSHWFHINIWYCQWRRFDIDTFSQLLPLYEGSHSNFIAHECKINCIWVNLKIHGTYSLTMIYRCLGSSLVSCYIHLYSFPPWRCICDITSLVFKCNLMIDIENIVWNHPQVNATRHIDDKSTFVQAMARRRKATRHYLMIMLSQINVATLCH